LLPLRPGIGIKEAYNVVRRKVPPVKGDRRFSEDIKKIDLIIKFGELLRRVEIAVGKLE
jgi:histidine ammonia-lyase